MVWYIPPEGGKGVHWLVIVCDGEGVGLRWGSGFECPKIGSGFKVRW